MTPAEVATKLRAFNDWRRGGDIEYPGPLAVDEAIDAAVEMIDRLEAAEKERDALRAELDALKTQEPVAWLHETRRDSDVVTSAVKQVWQRARPMSLAAYSIPLYLAPGAKGEEK